MRRATPSMHCSFSPSRSFSFFFPNRMTETWKLTLDETEHFFHSVLAWAYFSVSFLWLQSRGSFHSRVRPFEDKVEVSTPARKKTKTNLLARTFSTCNASSSPEDSWTCSWHCSFPYPTLLFGSSPFRHLSVSLEASSQPAAPLAPWGWSVVLVTFFQCLAVSLIVECW